MEKSQGEKNVDHQSTYLFHEKNRMGQNKKDIEPEDDSETSTSECDSDSSSASVSSINSYS